MHNKAGVIKKKVCVRVQIARASLGPVLFSHDSSWYQGVFAQMLSFFCTTQITRLVNIYNSHTALADSYTYRMSRRAQWCLRKKQVALRLFAELCLAGQSSVISSKSAQTNVLFTLAGCGWCSMNLGSKPGQVNLEVVVNRLHFLSKMTTAGYHHEVYLYCTSRLKNIAWFYPWAWLLEMEYSWGDLSPRELLSALTTELPVNDDRLCTQKMKITKKRSSFFFSLAWAYIWPVFLWLVSNVKIKVKDFSAPTLFFTEHFQVFM